MIIALYILAWLLSGFIGSTALFYTSWGKEIYRDGNSVSLCQAAFRSLLGPINIWMLVLMSVVISIMNVVDYIRENNRCTKILFKKDVK